MLQIKRNANYVNEDSQNLKETTKNVKL